MKMSVDKSQLAEVVKILSTIDHDIEANVKELDMEKLLIHVDKFKKTIDSFIQKSKSGKRRYVFQDTSTFSDKESIMAFVKSNFGRDISGQKKQEIVKKSIEATMQVTFDELLNLRTKFKEERQKPIRELTRRSEEEIRNYLSQLEMQEIKDLFRGSLSSKTLNAKQKKETLVKKIIKDIRKRKSVSHLGENPS